MQNSYDICYQNQAHSTFRIHAIHVAITTQPVH